MIGENADLNQVERLLHRLLLLAATSAFALVTASAIAADVPAAADPDIVRLVREVSPARLETYVRTLAGFGTRHSLSVSDDSKRGIGAARRWIRDTLDRCADESDARLKVEFDEFVQEATPHIPKATSLANVVATLEGADSQAKRRTLVVSGHYDSMCGNVMNFECDAPGGNDDASGTAVVIELACTFAKSRFAATLVFMAVAGEEQGLLGAAHWARVAHEKGVNVEAMITNDIVGNAHDENGRRDASTLRLFAEGVPAGKEVTEEWQRRLETSGENDSPARELARTIRDAAQRYVPEMTVKVVYRRDRYLRGGDHIPFLAQGYPAVRFTEAHEDFRHQHQDVRAVDGVQYVDPPERRRARLARACALPTIGCAYRDSEARKPDDVVLARQSRGRSRGLRNHMARDHGAVLARRRVCWQRHPRQRAAVQRRLPVLGARSRQRRAAQPRHLSADAAQSARATREVTPRLGPGGSLTSNALIGGRGDDPLGINPAASVTASAASDRGRSTPATRAEARCAPALLLRARRARSAGHSGRHRSRPLRAIPDTDRRYGTATGESCSERRAQPTPRAVARPPRDNRRTFRTRLRRGLDASSRRRGRRGGYRAWCRRRADLRDQSFTQLVSHVLPPSSEKACSQRGDGVVMRDHV